MAAFQNAKLDRYGDLVKMGADPNMKFSSHMGGTLAKQLPRVEKRATLSPLSQGAGLSALQNDSATFLATGSAPFPNNTRNIDTGVETRFKSQVGYRLQY